MVPLMWTGLFVLGLLCAAVFGFGSGALALITMLGAGFVIGCAVSPKEQEMLLTAVTSRAAFILGVGGAGLGLGALLHPRIKRARGRKRH